MSGDIRLFDFSSFVGSCSLFVVICLQNSNKTTILAALFWKRGIAALIQVVMNWRLIISWTVKFAVCTAVYNLSVWLTNSAGLAFFMALGLLILLAILESYVIDWIKEWRERRKAKRQEQ